MKFSGSHPYFDYCPFWRTARESDRIPALKKEVGEWLDENAKGLVEVETIYHAPTDEYWGRLKFSNPRDEVLFRMFWD